MLKKNNFCLLIGTTLCLVAACHTEPHQTPVTDDVKHVADAVRHVTHTTSYKLYEKIRVSDQVAFWFYEPRIIGAKQTTNGVRYIFDNGDHMERSGGTIAWRNNNPGCIRYSANAVAMGAIGKANGFAIFPDEQTGMHAIETLLTSENYRDLTIARAITKYAPPHENNTTGYINNLCRVTGLNQNQKIRDLNDSLLTKVVHTIRKLEGWHEGTERVLMTPDIPEPIKELSQLGIAKNTYQLQKMGKTL